MTSSLTTFNAGSLLLALVLGSLLLCDAAAEWLQTVKLTDSVGEEDDEFGRALAIDNGILVVGAYLDGVGGVEDAGSVTIFELIDGEWVAQQKLMASDADAYDYFGYSVAISNGIVAVGAVLEDDGGAEAGAVYIYEMGAERAWTERQKLIYSDAVGDEIFGLSLAMQGDTLIVGADCDNSDRGCVFLFTLSAAHTWTQSAMLTADDGNANDQFGYAVTIDADTIVVGARQDDELGRYSGSAYVFQRTGEGSSWTQVAKLTPRDGQAGDWFGQAVVIEGEMVWLGSRNNVDGTNAGAVYQFGEEVGGTWTQQNKLVARDSERYAYFGRDLAVRDGTLVVGAWYRSTRFAIEAGAVYLFENSAEGTWTQRAKLVAGDGAAGDYFGYAVAVDDRMVIAGAYGDDSSRGSVYAFEWHAPSCPPGLIRCLLCTFFGIFCRHTEVTQSP